MTKEETKAAAQVMLAWAEGKTVKVKRRLYEDEWDPVAGVNPTWNWDGFVYRIKQEPREWWMKTHRDGIPCTSCGLFHTLESAQEAAADDQSTSIIKVREVLE